MPTWTGKYDNVACHRVFWHSLVTVLDICEPKLDRVDLDVMNFFEQYTFILTASKELAKQCVRYGGTYSKNASRKNVGVRMPDDPVCQAILEKMGAPLISTRFGNIESLELCDT